MTITKKKIRSYEAFLKGEERSAATREKYMREVNRFAIWLGDRALSKETAVQYKASLQGKASTVNGALSALNSFFLFLGRADCRVRHLRVQRQTYRSEDRELTKDELHRLIRTSEREGSERLARAIETIAATGIRVSELHYFTVEALREREITITNKGKTRTVLLTKDLTVKLKQFARRRGIRSGPLFVTRSGRPLSRTQLWAEMKALCERAGVQKTKVFPHNLRHLFAVVYYRLHKDIAKLADLLGHSSINTTRIYLIETGKEHLRQLEAMRMVL